MIETKSTVKARLWRWATFVAYGCGHVQNDMFAAVWFQFYLIFVKEVLGKKVGQQEKVPRTRPDTRHKMRLVCVLFTFDNNAGPTDLRTYGRTDQRTDGRTRPLKEMRRRI